jgi:cell division septum initiation protein DivIVA
MTEAERRRRIEDLRERMRETDRRVEQDKIETARVLAQIDRALARLAASR